MSTKTISIDEKMNVKAFQENLISWFEASQRQLPWRENKDPYRVWVSEIMLQQTRVDTVIPYFNRFLEQFPTIEALANAQEDKVLKAWEGLGYYSRARNLHSAVKEVHETYGGKVPDTPEEISKLKGVGPYTAGAILSIAYDVPEPAVDGNVMRVFSRLLLITDDIAKPSSRKIFEAAVRETISHENPSYFNQALMELGALICTPTSPSCLLCPVMEHCLAFNEGIQEQLPVKTKAKKQRQVKLAAAILCDESGKILIHKRPSEGLLANMWEFSNTEVSRTIKSEREQLSKYLYEQYAIEATIEEYIGQIDHIFSHLHWNIHAFSGKLTGAIKETANLKLVTFAELADYALPVPQQKLLKKYVEVTEKTLT